jgi:hypothetical protein
VEGLIRYYAAIHGANADDMVAVAMCESSLNPNAVGDITLGTSRGIFQIHKPSHPTITDAQAFDPDWSSEWAARHFAAGRQSMWTCARKLGIV